jgi:hypothetical protein
VRFCRKSGHLCGCFSVYIAQARSAPALRVLQGIVFPKNQSMVKVGQSHHNEASIMRITRALRWAIRDPATQTHMHARTRTHTHIHTQWLVWGDKDLFWISYAVANMPLEFNPYLPAEIGASACVSFLCVSSRHLP